jgi:glycogen debranching enzyme
MDMPGCKGNSRSDNQSKKNAHTLNMVSTISTPPFLTGLPINLLRVSWTLLTLFLIQPVSFAQSVKGQTGQVHTIRLTKNPTGKINSEGSMSVWFLAPVPYEKAGKETRAAFDFLNKIPGISGRYLLAEELPGSGKKLKQADVLWIHRDETTEFRKVERDRRLLSTLKTYVEGGGRIMLTQQAMHYLNFLGYESSLMEDSTKSCTDKGFGRRLGFHSFISHPVFEGLHGGAYVCWPQSDMTTRITGLFGDRVPANGKTVAVDWDYIFLREQTKLVFEYAPGNGRILAVGGYMLFGTPNRNRAHLEMFTRNCLHYLHEKDPQSKHINWWNYSSCKVMELMPPPESDRVVKAMPPSEKWREDVSEITLNRRFASRNFWDVAGERIVTMGLETGGIEEIWAHPFMALRDYRVGIRFSYRDTIYWLNDERPEISVNPANFTRSYKFPRAYLKEVVVNDPNRPAGVVHYEYRGVYEADLFIQFTSNLRWMWPYSEKVTGSVCHRWNDNLSCIEIHDRTGRLHVMAGGNKPPVKHQAGQYESFIWSRKDSVMTGVDTQKCQVAFCSQFRLGMNDNLDIVIAASCEGCDTTSQYFEQAIMNPASVYERALQHNSNILTDRLMVTTPDKEFNTGYRWSVVATDRFMVRTPGMGRALVAGYATTQSGWNGGHQVNGRPGYAWYFGRDAVWSAFAMLDYSDYDKVRSQLEFFNHFQDLNGKIFHEASTSGFIHYDAADATPLYILLAGKYFRHSNDTAFLRNTWPNIKKAIDFCFSTDTDQDHLIENTNVGHGWVEGGKLYGSHATIYMTGIWSAALREAYNMAGFLGQAEAENYRLEADETQKIINSRFWEKDASFFSYGMNKDGTFRNEPTVLPAVPIYLGTTEPTYASACIRQYSSNAFTTNWGVRIIRDDSPMFNPTGYHYGSVWPLFTGWTALAGYKTGNPLQGFSHIMNNLKVFKKWGLGFVEEVLNGTEYSPSGVCPHQCWSETMVIQPVIEGLLGLTVDAGNRKITLAPALPADWDSLVANNIRVGNQYIDFQYQRTTDTKRNYRFSLHHGNDVSIDFMPGFPAGTRIKSVRLDGQEIPHTVFTTSQGIVPYVRIKLGSAIHLEIETEGGIAVLPVVADPKPGDQAAGLRIISTHFTGSRFIAEIEGPCGTTGSFRIWSAAGNITTPSGTRLIGRNGNVSEYETDFEKTGEKYQVKIIDFEYIRK